jgi:hypothetical protein
MTTPHEGAEDRESAVDATVESPAAAARTTASTPTPAPAPPARRVPRRAWVLAIAADAVQLAFMPFFAPGGVSPVDAALDVAVAALLVRWCGWHWAFLPSFAAELVPGVDLVPSWTLAVWLASLGRPRPGSHT